MNIFFLALDPKICAMYHLDKHVVKMIIEYAQLLSTAHRVLDGDLVNKRHYKLYDDRENTLYKTTHINHPSSIWTRQYKQNYIWLYMLFCELCDEYTYRYGKIHLCDKKLRTLLKDPPYNIPVLDDNNTWIGPTPAMPDECKVNGNNLLSYHNYYRQFKTHIAVWTKRDTPKWYYNNSSTHIQHNLHNTVYMFIVRYGVESLIKNEFIKQADVSIIINKYF